MLTTLALTLLAQPLAIDNRMEAPEDRQCFEVFYSPPSSIWLKSHEPGNQYIRFPERKVRGQTRYRLSFVYLIARGTEGATAVRVSQYHDTKAAWRSLGSTEIALKTVGRWQRIDTVIVTHKDATTVAIDARVTSETEVGEAWLDDVSFRVVGEPVTQGP